MKCSIHFQAGASFEQFRSSKGALKAHMYNLSLCDLIDKVALLLPIYMKMF